MKKKIGITSILFIALVYSNIDITTVIDRKNLSLKQFSFIRNANAETGEEPAKCYSSYKIGDETVITHCRFKAPCESIQAQLGKDQNTCD